MRQKYIDAMNAFVAAFNAFAADPTEEGENAYIDAHLALVNLIKELPE